MVEEEEFVPLYAGVRSLFRARTTQESVVVQYPGSFTSRGQPNLQVALGSDGDSYGRISTVLLPRGDTAYINVVFHTFPSSCPAFQATWFIPCPNMSGANNGAKIMLDYSSIFMDAPTAVWALIIQHG